MRNIKQARAIYYSKQEQKYKIYEKAINDLNLQKEFEDLFPHEETEDQLFSLVDDPEFLHDLKRNAWKEDFEKINVPTLIVNGGSI